jgi:hypothetical protein
MTGIAPIESYKRETSMMPLLSSTCLIFFAPRPYLFLKTKTLFFCPGFRLT